MTAGETEDVQMVRSDHGTAQQAIEYALDHTKSAWTQEAVFLNAWMQGDLDEWPEFYEWLDAQPRPARALAMNADPIAEENNEQPLSRRIAAMEKPASVDQIDEADTPTTWPPRSATSPEDLPTKLREHAAMIVKAWDKRYAPDGIGAGIVRPVEVDTMLEAADALAALSTPTAQVEREAVEWEGPLTDEEQAMIDRAWEKHKAAGPCDRPPSGWTCSRQYGHDGTCAASPATLTRDQAVEAAREKAVVKAFDMRAWDVVSTCADNLEDEGDRVYLGSTNHADLLKEYRNDLFQACFLRTAMEARDACSDCGKKRSAHTLRNPDCPAYVERNRAARAALQGGRVGL